MANGKSTPQACKEAGIHTQTYYRWRKEYGGLKVEQAKRMKELETQEEPIANVVDRVAGCRRNGHLRAWRQVDGQAKQAASDVIGCAGRGGRNRHQEDPQTWQDGAGPDPWSGRIHSKRQVPRGCWREFRDLSQAALARTAGVNRVRAVTADRFTLCASWPMPLGLPWMT